MNGRVRMRTLTVVVVATIGTLAAVGIAVSQGENEVSPYDPPPEESVTPSDGPLDEGLSPSEVREAPMGEEEKRDRERRQDEGLPEPRPGDTFNEGGN